MHYSQQLTRAVNGKVVYLFKIVDSLSTKLNVLSDDLKSVDNTFSSWSKKKLNKFANTVRCHESLMMEFLSKYSAEIIRTFFSFSKLTKIQDIVRQLVKINEKIVHRTFRFT